MATYNKAWLAALVTGLTAVIAQVSDKTEFSDLSPLQWVVVVLSAVVAGSAVYATPNRPVS